MWLSLGIIPKEPTVVLLGYYRSGGKALVAAQNPGGGVLYSAPFDLQHKLCRLHIQQWLGRCGVPAELATRTLNKIVDDLRRLLERARRRVDERARKLKGGTGPL